MTLSKLAVRSLSTMLFVGVLGLWGCSSEPQAAKPTLKPISLPPKIVPEYMRGTIFEQVDLIQTDPARASGYGLVVGLDNTGDTRAPGPVRDYIVKQMRKHGFGSSMMQEYKRAQPETVLKDARVAIVRVDAYIPPGARRGQTFDVQVSALENSNTTSLAHGQLYECDLAPRGADPMNPGGGLINPWAHVQGPIFVNPSYLAAPTQGESGKLSMRYGLVMGTGVNINDRAIVLRLRQPQWKLSRAIEERLNDRFQQVADYDRKTEVRGYCVAQAQDDSTINLYVPKSYQGDWEHFASVAMHTYFNPNADVGSIRAAQLGKAILEPGALTGEISYAFEAIGEPALPTIRALLNHASSEIAFAAARAGAQMNDGASLEALRRLALAKGDAFQISAIQTLGKLNPTPQVREILYSVIDSDQNLARLEAYKVMANNTDPRVLSQDLPGGFKLDLVPSEGKPIVFASRSGIPRVAIIGSNHKPTLRTPITFLTIGRTFQITDEPANPDVVNLFNRGTSSQRDVSVRSPASLAQVLLSVGGVGEPGEPKIRMGFSETVAMLTGLSEQQLICMPDKHAPLPVAFFFQNPAVTDDPIINAPAIEDQRTQPTDVPQIGSTTDAGTTPVASPTGGRSQTP